MSENITSSQIDNDNENGLPNPSSSDISPDIHTCQDEEIDEQVIEGVPKEQDEGRQGEYKSDEKDKEHTVLHDLPLGEEQGPHPPPRLMPLGQKCLSQGWVKLVPQEQVWNSEGHLHQRTKEQDLLPQDQLQLRSQVQDCSTQMPPLRAARQRWVSQEQIQLWSQVHDQFLDGHLQQRPHRQDGLIQRRVQQQPQGQNWFIQGKLQQQPHEQYCYAETQLHEQPQWLSDFIEGQHQKSPGVYPQGQNWYPLGEISQRSQRQNWYTKERPPERLQRRDKMLQQHPSGASKGPSVLPKGPGGYPQRPKMYPQWQLQQQLHGKDLHPQGKPMQPLPQGQDSEGQPLQQTIGPDDHTQSLPQLPQLSFLAQEDAKKELSGASGDKHSHTISYINEKITRKTFKIIVTIILFIMVFATILFLLLIQLIRKMKSFFSLTYLHATFLSMIFIVILGCVMVSSTCARRRPANYICLILLEIFVCFLCGAISSLYAMPVILYAFIATMVCVIFCTLLTKNKSDFTKCIMVMIALALTLFAGGIILSILYGAIGFYSRILLVIYLVIFGLVVLMVLVIALQAVYGGKSMELDEDDYAFAIFMLYTVIMALNLVFVRLIGIGSDEGRPEQKI